MKLLIVEDEEKTGNYLRQGLTEAGFAVELARNGLDGLHLAATGDHDLLVPKVMLLDVDGWRSMRSLCESWPRDRQVDRRGTVVVRSGGGSTCFTIRLPATAEAVRSTANPVASSTRSAGSSTATD